jgi:FtsH-binding integral membrane protein
LIKNLVKLNQPKGDAFNLKVESIAVVTLMICIFLSFYFAYLSIQEIDDTLKKQLVTFAAYTLITGIVIMACMTIYIGLKRAFPKMESRLKRSEEPSEPDET